MEKVIKNILEKKMNDDQVKRFIKLITAGINEKEERKKKMIINGLYNLEFEL